MKICGKYSFFMFNNKTNKDSIDITAWGPLYVRFPDGNTEILKCVSLKDSKEFIDSMLEVECGDYIIIHENENLEFEFIESNLSNELLPNEILNINHDVFEYISNTGRVLN